MNFKNHVESGVMKDIPNVTAHVDKLKAVSVLAESLLCGEKDAKPRAGDVLQVFEIDVDGLLNALEYL